jgi:hypothetical protein
MTERYFIKGRDLNIRVIASGDFSLTGTADGYEIETSGPGDYLFGKPVEVTQTVPEHFIEQGKQRMQDKYLIIRRDGTVPTMDLLAGEIDNHEFGPPDPSILQVMRDCQGGKVFIAAAWDADQLRREQEKDAQP